MCNFDGALASNENSSQYICAQGSSTTKLFIAKENSTGISEFTYNSHCICKKKSLLNS